MLPSSSVGNHNNLIRLAMMGALLLGYLLAACGLWAAAQVLLACCFVGLVAVGLALPGHARLYLVSGLLLALVLIALSTPSGGWDARSIWLFHAKRIYLDGSLYAQLDGYAKWSQNDYPPLAPFAMASFARAVGVWNDVFPKAMVVVLLAPALLSIASTFCTAAGVAGFLLATVATGSFYLVNGYIDMPLALYFVAAAVAAKTICRRHRATPMQIALAAATFAVLALLKNEGLVLLAIVGGASFLAALATHRRIPWRLLASLALGLLPLVAWKLALLEHHIINDLASSDMGGKLRERLPNLFYTVFILKEMLLRPAAILPGVTMLATWRYWGRSPWAWAAWLSVVAYAAVLYFVYMTTPHDVRWHLQTSVARTSMPLMSMLAFMAISVLDARLGRFLVASGRQPEETP